MQTAFPPLPAPARPDPEWRLLLGCVRAHVRPDLEATASTAAVDWPLFMELVRHHAVLPLVHAHLAAPRRSQLPDGVRAELERLFLLNVGSNRGMTARLFEILELLEGEGMTAIPFKGPSLAVKAYGDLCLRPFSDLDVFVPPGAALRARALLEDQGFVSVGSDGAAAGSTGPRSGYHFTMLHEASNLTVELHWGIAPRFFAFPMDDDRWWRTESSIDLLGRPVPQFANEVQLLLLCVHGGRHLWERLAWVCDVALLAAREDLDWDGIAALAKDLGVGRMVNLGMILAQRLLDAPLPEAVVARSHDDRAARRLAVKVLEAMRTGATASEVNVPRFFLRLQERRADWLRLLFYLMRSKLA